MPPVFKIHFYISLFLFLVLLLPWLLSFLKKEMGFYYYIFFVGLNHTVAVEPIRALAKAKDLIYLQTVITCLLQC